jgi:hypothetical protein
MLRKMSPRLSPDPLQGVRGHRARFGRKVMMHETAVQQLICDLFEEEALVIGGLVSTHCPDDDFVWALVRSLDQIRQRSLDRLMNVPDTSASEDTTFADPSRPHPAVEEFLRRINESDPRPKENTPCLN